MAKKPSTNPSLKVTRLRYTEGNGILVSQPVFAKTQMVTAEIYLVSKYFVIKSDTDKQITNRIEFKTRAQAMKLVKQALKDLGVQFYSEARSRSKTSPVNTLEVYPYEAQHRVQDLEDLDMQETEAWLAE